MKKKLIGFLFVFFLSGIFFLKDALVTKAVELYVRKSLQEASFWKAESVQREEEQLVLQKGVVQTPYGIATFEELRLSVHLSLLPFSFEPSIELSGLCLQLDTGAKGSSLRAPSLWIPPSFFSPKLSIVDGKILCPLQEEISFLCNYFPGEKKGDLGTLTLREEESSQDFLSLVTTMQGQSIHLQGQIHQGKMAYLLPLLSFYDPTYLNGWSEIEGQVFAKADGKVHLQKGIEKIELELQVASLNLNNPRLGFTLASRDLQGTLAFCPSKEEGSFWKNLELFSTFAESKMLFQQEGHCLGVEEALGEVRLFPGKDPYLKVSGQTFTKGQRIPFEMEGKGELVSGEVHRLQARLDLFVRREPSSLSLSFCQKEGKEALFQVEGSSFSKEAWTLFDPVCSLLKWPHVRLDRGSIDAKICGWLEEGRISKLQVTEGKARDMVLSIPSCDLSVQAKDLEVGAICLFPLQGRVAIESLDCKVSKGLIAYQEKNVSDLEMALQVQQGKLCNVLLQGCYQGILAKLVQRADDAFSMNAKIPSSFLQEQLGLKVPKQDSLEWTLEWKETDQKMLMHSILTLSKQEEIVLDALVEGGVQKALRTLSAPWDLSTCKGSFYTKDLSSWSSWLEGYLPSSLKVQGEMSAEGSFHQKGIQVQVSEASVTFAKDSLQGTVEGRGEAFYDFQKGFQNGVFPVQRAFIQDGDLSLELVDSSFFFEGRQLWSDEWKVTTSSGIYARGSLFLDENKLHLLAKSVQGTLSSEDPFVKRYIPAMGALSWTAQVTLEEGKSFLEIPFSDKARWKVEGLCTDVTCALGAMGSIQQGQVFVSLHSDKPASFQRIRGEYRLGATSLACSASDLVIEEGKPIPFSLTMKDQQRLWLELRGKVDKQKDRFCLSLQAPSHILGLPISAEPFWIGEGGVVSPIRFTSLLSFNKLSSYVCMWKEMGLLEAEIDVGLFSSLQGTASIQGVYHPEESRVSVALQSKDCCYQGAFVGDVSCRLQGKGSHWNIESCQIGTHALKASLQWDPREWKVSSFSWQFPSGSLSARGSYFPKSHKLLCPDFSCKMQEISGENIDLRGHVEGVWLDQRFQGKGGLHALASWHHSLTVETAKEMPFLIDSLEGISSDKSEWEIVSSLSHKVLAKGSIQKMTYLFPSKQLSMKGGSLQVARHALEEIEEAPLWLQEISGQRPLQLQLEAELGAKETKISGSLGKDTFSFWDDAMQLGAVQFLYKPGQLYLTSQSHLHGKPLQLQAQALFNGSPSLHLLIKEDAQHKGLALQCLMDPKEGYWYVEKAQGELSGLIVQAGRIGKKEQDLCRYEVEVHVDFAKMSALLPKASADMIMTYEIGKGYTYRGTAAVRWAQPVKFVGLAGEVLAKDFVLFGKSMKSLRSFLEMDEMHGQVRGLKLEDDVGILSAKAISFSYLPKEKTYQVEAPLIHVKDLVPAFFLKEAKKKGVEIKNVSFYDIKGKLGDLSSFQAKGSLHFSSISKKEFSFWDIPLSLLKDFGLDPGLLTPSIGEADLSVHHGRIYFTDLRNAYSEEKRSQFYLAEPGTDAYLGLDGSWHVDLKMKQNVVWKVTEDLILSVRGSLDNPKYSLKASSN